MIGNFNFYAETFFLALLFSTIGVFLARKAALTLNLNDSPNEIKTHKGTIPVLGGIGVFFGFSIALIIMRLFTSFPTGTLRDLRYILIGSVLILFLGVIDDMKKPKGLSVGFKFSVQIIVAVFMVFWGFKIKFIEPSHFSFIISVLWIVGITNAFNIIDIMDGLSSSQVFAAGLAFLFIALPSESIYVNFLAASLSGAVLGFIPYNFSGRFKIFMGDGGSLFCGFVLAVLSLGTEYSSVNVLGVYAPLFILAIPIYDTLFVSFMRIRRGVSPFSGSRDHYALRLEQLGLSRKKIVLFSFLASVILGLSAFVSTRVSASWGVLIYLIVGLEFLILSCIIWRIKV